MRLELRARTRPPAYLVGNQDGRRELLDIFTQHSARADELTVRARLAEKLSAAELALLDDLERERVAYTGQDQVPGADKPQSKQPGVSATDLEGGGRQEVGGAPRRRRKKERAVA